MLGILIGIVAVAFFRSHCVPEEKMYEYSVEENGVAGGTGGGPGSASGSGGAVNPFNATALSAVGSHDASGMPNGDLGQESSLLSHSDSGGFTSHKADSVVAVAAGGVGAAGAASTLNRRESMMYATESDPMVPDLYGRADDKRNGNLYGYGGGAGGGQPLETMM